MRPDVGSVCRDSGVEDAFKQWKYASGAETKKMEFKFYLGPKQREVDF
jgi:hypothetical protein